MKSVKYLPPGANDLFLESAITKLQKQTNISTCTQRKKEKTSIM